MINSPTKKEFEKARLDHRATTEAQTADMRGDPS